MTDCCINEFHDGVEARKELAAFLSATLPGGKTRDQWLKHFSFWWDQNPYASKHPCRGWVLQQQDGTVVGYIGAIPAAYSYAGKCLPALLATTWVVLPEHRSAAGLMGLKLHRLGKKVLLVDSTPSPNVQAMLTRMGWRSELSISRRFVPMGPFWNVLARLTGDRGSVTKPGRRLVAGVSAIRSVAQPWQSDKGIEKWITPEYLEWYLKSPSREHHLLSFVDAEGCLSSYILLTPARIKGIPGWQVIDWFTTEETNEELTALVTALAQKPSLLSDHRRFVIALPSFPQEDPWGHLSAVWRRTESLGMFYFIPPEFQHLAKRSVLAEGDWGI